MQQNQPPKLILREESVVRLVVQGMVNRKIAESFDLRAHREDYRFGIFDKWGRIAWSWRRMRWHALN